MPSFVSTVAREFAMPTARFLLISALVLLPITLWAAPQSDSPTSADDVVAASEDAQAGSETADETRTAEALPSNASAVPPGEQSVDRESRRNIRATSSVMSRVFCSSTSVPASGWAQASRLWSSGCCLGRPF